MEVRIAETLSDDREQIKGGGIEYIYVILKEEWKTLKLKPSFVTLTKNGKSHHSREKREDLLLGATFFCKSPLVITTFPKINP